VYYELHGAGGTPLLLLPHGGLFNIDLQFGQLIPGLAATRQIIAPTSGGTDGQVTSTAAHQCQPGVQCGGPAPAPERRAGRRLGFSVGGAVALYLAIKHPELVRKLIVSSVSFHPTVTVRRTPRRWRH
jgi:hypothetical protein